MTVWIVFEGWPEDGGSFDVVGVYCLRGDAERARDYSPYSRWIEESELEGDVVEEVGR